MVSHGQLNESMNTQIGGQTHDGGDTKHAHQQQPVQVRDSGLQQPLKAEDQANSFYLVTKQVPDVVNAVQDHGRPAQKTCNKLNYFSNMANVISLYMQ